MFFIIQYRLSGNNRPRVIFVVQPYIPFLPMEPTLCQAAFDDTDYGFQVKWDGVRIIAHVKNGIVELFNRKKLIRTKQYPEIVSLLPKLFKSDIILDGEMIVINDGKPSFSQLIRRDFAVDERTIKNLKNMIPVTYVAFDILYNDGKSLVTHPFQFRDELLKSLLPSKDPVVVTDTFPETGIALFSVVKQAGLEGVVAKKLESHYHIGRKNSDWLKIKNRRTLSAIIGGYLSEGQEVRSLFLGVFQDDGFLYIGRAGSGMTYQESRLLFERLQKSGSPYCPFINPPIANKKQIPHWVNPSIEVLIEYMDFTDDGYIRHPVIKQIEF